MNSQISGGPVPTLQGALIEKALVHYEAKEFDQARTVSDELLRLQPRDYAALHLAGVVATAQKRLPEAAEFLKLALNYAPDAEKAGVSWFALGKALRAAQDLRQAEEAFRRALRLNPSVSSYYIELSETYFEGSKINPAIETLQAAIRRLPTDPIPCAALGNILNRCGRHSDALISFDLAVSRNPEFAQAHLARGSTLKILGRFPEADAALRQALRLDPMVPAYYQLVQLEQFTANAQEISEIKTRLAKPGSVPEATRVDALYALSKIYDGLKDYPSAFQCLEEASKLHRATFEYSIDAHGELVERIIALFTPDFLARFSGKNTSQLAPVFILGMPRSGTTLTEQILASHSKVQGGGELFHIYNIAKRLGATWESRGSSAPGDDATVVNDLIQASGRYQDATAHLWRKKPRFTDKMPLNFLYIGVIHFLFPKASIIYCRRNPAAACFSCFQQLFTPGSLLFSYDLTELGRFYKLHERMMEHWKKVLPGYILEVEYETLVERPEPEVERILKYCNLEFEPACLDFHTLNRPIATASVMQVRKPVYKSSIDHWRNYEPFLGPLLETLKLR